MKTGCFLAGMVMFIVSGTTLAQSTQMGLTVDGSTVEVDFNHEQPQDKGYLTYGIGASYHDHHDRDYKILRANLDIGSDTMAPNLKTNLGFMGIAGKVGKKQADAHVAGLGFNGQLEWKLPQGGLPLPVSLFGGVTWAPGILCVSDLDRYHEFRTGVHVHFARQAYVIVAYSHRQFDLDTWTLNHDFVSFGLALKF